MLKITILINNYFMKCSKSEYIYDDFNIYIIIKFFGGLGLFRIFEI